MTEMHEVRRHSDGSIDMEFYRARAHALRRAQIAQLARASRRHVVQLFTPGEPIRLAFLVTQGTARPIGRP